jgi:hypothetical protein
MEALNFTGLCAAANTLVFIGIGFLWVIKLDYYFGACIKRIILFIGIVLLIASLLITNFTWAAITGLLAGVAILCWSLFAQNNTWSAVIGIVGMTTLWDGLEIFRQEKRIIKGHAPENPKRPVSQKTQ